MVVLFLDVESLSDEFVCQYPVMIVAIKIDLELQFVVQPKLLLIIDLELITGSF